MRVAHAIGAASVVLVIRTVLVHLAHCHTAAHLLVAFTSRVRLVGRTLQLGLITETVAALGLVGLSVFDAHDSPQETKFVKSGVNEVCNLINEILQLGIVGEMLTALLYELFDLFHVGHGINF